MSTGSHLAGKAINISKTTAPHALSYPFTSHFGIPHGQAVALTLPSILSYNSEVKDDDLNDSRGVKFVKDSLDQILGILGVNSAREASEALTKLFKDIGLADILNKVTPKDIDLILKEVSVERMQNNPRCLDAFAVRKILQNIIN